RSGILSLISVLAVTGLIRGDCREERDLRDDPLLTVVDGRELAQARVALGRINDLALAKLADARYTAAGRFKEFLAGRGTLEFVIGSRYRLLDSELALAVNDTDRVATYERLWEIADVVEGINKARQAAGRIAIQDYMSSVVFCRDAAIRLFRARQKPGAMLPLVGPRLESEDYWWDEWDSRELAQAKLQVSNTPIAELLKEKRKAADV